MPFGKPYFKVMIILSSIQCISIKERLMDFFLWLTTIPPSWGRKNVLVNTTGRLSGVNYSLGISPSQAAIWKEKKGPVISDLAQPKNSCSAETPNKKVRKFRNCSKHIIGSEPPLLTTIFTLQWKSSHSCSNSTRCLPFTALPTLLLHITVCSCHLNWVRAGTISIVFMIVSLNSGT